MSIGELVLARHWGDDNTTWLTINRADPYIEIDDALLDMIELADSTHPQMVCLEGLDEPEHFTGTLLHINGRDQHVVYRIGEYKPEHDRWGASWPD